MDCLAHSLAQWQINFEGITNFRVPETAWEPEQPRLCRDEAKGWRVGGSNPNSFKIFISSPSVQILCGPHSLPLNV